MIYFRYDTIIFLIVRREAARSIVVLGINVRLDFQRFVCRQNEPKPDSPQLS